MKSLSKPQNAAETVAIIKSTIFSLFRLMNKSVAFNLCCSFTVMYWVYFKIQQYQIKNRNSRKNYYNFGIKNRGNTCYVNSALQMVRQIYLSNKDFLALSPSPFANTLTAFFIDQRSEKQKEEDLEKILQVLKRQQTHEVNGGDSFISLINILNTISSEVLGDAHQNNQQSACTDFQNFYCVRTNEGFQCQNCKTFHKKSIEGIDFIEEGVNNIDLINFSQPQIFLESIQAQQLDTNIHCETCNSEQQFHLNRIITHYPQYVIVKFTRDTIQNLEECFQDKEIILNSDASNSENNYKIIGYCSYSGNHYTYTAKYDDTWVMFSDNYISHPQQLFRNIYYLLLIKSPQPSVRVV